MNYLVKKIYKTINLTKNIEVFIYKYDIDTYVSNS